jgi:hypothetical protein
MTSGVLIWQLFPARVVFAITLRVPRASHLHRHLHILPLLLHTISLPYKQQSESFTIPRHLTTSQYTKISATMGKRKHSADVAPLPISSFGAVSTPDSQSPMYFSKGYDGIMEMDAQTNTRPNGWDFTSASRVKSSDWGNRTRKRVRDNRPDERAIHGVSPLLFDTEGVSY